MKKYLYYIATVLLLPSVAFAADPPQCKGVKAISGNAGCDAAAFKGAIAIITSTNTDFFDISFFNLHQYRDYKSNKIFSLSDMQPFFSKHISI